MIQKQLLEEFLQAVYLTLKEYTGKKGSLWAQTTKLSVQHQTGENEVKCNVV